MENYYFDLSRLPEKFNNDTVKKFMEQHKFHVYEPSKAPKNKHIGSGAWHDDVIAFVEENFKEVVAPQPSEFSIEAVKEAFSAPVEELQDYVVTTTPVEEVVDKSVQKENLAELMKTDEEHGMYEGTLLSASTDQELSATVVPAESKKKKAAKKVAEAPNPTDNNGVA